MVASKDSPSGQSPQRVLIVFMLLAAGFAGGAALYYAFEPDELNMPEEQDTSPPLSPSEDMAQRVMQLTLQGAFTQAEELAREWIRTHPEGVEVRTALAQLYASTGRTTQAETLIDDVLARDENYPYACWVKGLLHADDPARAGAWFAKAAAQDSAGPRIWGNYGLWLMQHGAPEQAGEYLQKAVDAGAEDADVYRALGQVRWQQGRQDAALELLRKAARQAPRDAGNWSALGEVYAARGEYDQAVEAIESGLDISRGPERALLHLQLGEIFERKGDYERAAEAYIRSTQLGHMALPGLLGAARCYHRAGQHAKAMSYVDQAYELTPEDPEVQQLREAIENARFGRPGGLLNFDPDIDGQNHRQSRPAPATGNDEPPRAPSFRID
jgi:tetratricopeptide (TPR) repeat protein